MSMDQIIDFVRALDEVVAWMPQRGDSVPEVAWGDAFFYCAPDGQVPTNVQPYATIVTKDYPDDTSSRLGGGRWRVNIHVDRRTFVALTGEEPRHLVLERDHAETDAILPHPVYGALGWISVVNPGERTTGKVLSLLRDAHESARRRRDRRS